MKKQDIVYMLKMMGDIVKYVIWAEREGLWGEWGWWRFLFCPLRVQSIQHQLAQLDSESWSGRAEADRDRDFMQLLREKEALLQEIILVSKQQHSAETLLQLEEERSRLEEEVQRAHSSQSQGANQRWERCQGLGF